MKSKTRPIKPFRRRLWWVYGGFIILVWLTMMTITLLFTQRHYEQTTPIYSNMTPVVPMITPTPPPAASGAVDAAPQITFTVT